MARKRKTASKKQRSIYRRKYSSLLIIECDAKKLENQSINIARELDEIFSFSPLCQHKFIQVYSKADLLSQFAELSAKKQKYDIIVLFGHSFTDRLGNPVGIKFASDFPIYWNVLPKYLENFKPRCLILATCKGGHFLPSSEMFNGLPTLKELFGSPVVTNQTQISILKILIPYIILAANGFDPDIWLSGSILNYFSTGGIILRHTRRDFVEKKPLREIQQLVYEFLRKLYQKLK